MQETIYTLPSCPVEIALLTDLHGKAYQKVISSVEKQSVDLICIAGDFAYGSWPKDDRSPLVTQEYVLPFLKGCAALAPTFVSLGNHEIYEPAAGKVYTLQVRDGFQSIRVGCLPTLIPISSSAVDWLTQPIYQEYSIHPKSFMSNTLDKIILGLLYSKQIQKNYSNALPRKVF